MSFVRDRLDMPGGRPPQPAHQFKLCSRCGQSRPPEGGVEMGPGRWRCAACWVKRAVHPGHRIDPVRKDEYDSGLDAVDR